MSHVTTCELEIKNLDDLASAGSRLGLELVRDAKDFRYYAGKREPCTHKLRVPEGAPRAEAYEVGVVEQADGTYRLLYDDFDRQICEIAGRGMQKLRQEYAVSVVRREVKRLKRDGYRVKEVRENGKVRVVATR
jgi:hypothetical protein